jgi:lysophospholipase L1-like esterase
LAQLQANNLSLWKALSSRQLKAFQTTITPSSTSTNTVPAANDSVRVAYNTWLRAGSPIDPATKNAVAVGTAGALLAGQAGHPLEGYFEIADLGETARNSGLWKAGYSGDGTHPTSTGHAALALGIDTTRIVVS